MKPKVYMLCPGLGRITRGYESFINECHEQLRECAEFDTWLFKSAGPKVKNSTNIPCLFRRSKFTKFIAYILGRHSYYIEQATFAFCMAPFLLICGPDLVFLSDGALANAIWHLRRIFKLKFKIIFSNGGPLPSALKRWDHVQQLVPAHLERGIVDGVPKERQTLLPYGLKMRKVFKAKSSDEVKELRAKLGLPQDRVIVISVGSINNYHKRMNYLIEEVHSLPEPRPFLLILGQEERESEEIAKMGIELLGEENITLKNVGHEEVNDYYRASDIFVLASLHEGLARVMLEANAKGLPCIAHDYEVSRFALGPSGYFTDMSKKGSLSLMIRKILNEGDKSATPEERHQYAYKNFSWDMLKDRYISLINKVLNNNA